MLILLGVLAGALAGLATPSFTHAAVVRNVNDTAAAADSGIEYGIQSLKNKSSHCLDVPPPSTLPTVRDRPSIARAAQVTCQVLPPATGTPDGLSFILLVSTAQLAGSASNTVESRAVLLINDRTGSATIMSWRSCRDSAC